jgi:quinone-modifying oxidoreductase subunit QmoB
LNLEDLSDNLNEEHHFKIYKTHPFLCNEEGVSIITNDIDKENLDAIIIGACSPRVNKSNFSFNPKVITERVNLREQVAWSTDNDDEDSFMLAHDNLRMGIAKAQVISSPKPNIEEDLSSDILVIGGGITGITSAIEGAKAGYKIIIVEKNEELGGWSNNLYKQLPQKQPYTQLEEPLIYQRIKEIEYSTNIEILNTSEIKEISGQPGMFEINISQNGNEIKRKVSSIVLATGWQPYEASNL